MTTNKRTKERETDHPRHIASTRGVSGLGPNPCGCVHHGKDPNVTVKACLVHSQENVITETAPQAFIFPGSFAPIAVSAAVVTPREKQRSMLYSPPALAVRYGHYRVIATAESLESYRRSSNH